MKNYHQLFKDFRADAPEPPAELSKKILLRIEVEERRQLRFKAIESGMILAGSISIVAVGYIETAARLSQSGFFQFASLIFSDFSVVASNATDFFFSLSETFPIFSAALLFCGVFFAVWSATRFLNEVSLLRQHKVLISR